MSSKHTAALRRLGVPHARQLVASTWSAVFAAEPDVPLDVWADSNRVIAEGTAENPGPWSTDRVPYAREPMRAITDPGVRRVVLMFASQVGKSEVLINALSYFVARRPAPCMIVYPDADMGKDIMRDRLMPNIYATPATARRLTGKAWDEKTDKLVTLGMTARVVGSHSRAKVASWPICYLIRDEIDEFAPEAIGRSEQRTKNFAHRKIIDASTPTYEHVGIHAEFLKGDQCRYAVPCPHCSGFQFLDFGFKEESEGGCVMWEGALEADVETVRETAWYRCAHCQGKIENRHKLAMLERGVWVNKSQTIARDGTITGPPSKGEVRSFTLSALYSPWLRFGDVAAGFIEAGGLPPMDWINGMLGEPWVVLGTSTDAETIVAIAGRSKPDYKRGEVLDDSPLLTGAIDVQLDHVYFEVLAWRFDGDPRNELLACSLIDWGRIEAPEIPPERFYRDLRDLERKGGDKDDLAAALRFQRLEGRGLLDRSFAVVSATTGRPVGRALQVVRWGMDAANDTASVYRFARRHVRNVLPVAGRGAGSLRTLVHTSAVDQLPDGRPFPGGVTLTLFDADHFRNIAYGAILRETPAPGATRWPVNYERLHAQQLTAEHRVTKPTKRGVTMHWERKPKKPPNHWWDCRVVNTLLGERLVVPALRQHYAKPAKRPTRLPGH